MVSVKQIRAARGLLGWTQKELADACGLSIRAINRLECNETNPRASTLNLIQLTLEKHDVIFFNEKGYIGVKIKDEDNGEVTFYKSK